MVFESGYFESPLYEYFEQFVVVSKVLHEEVPHFFLKAIRLSSLHEKINFSPGGPHSRHPGPNMWANTQK